MDFLPPKDLEDFIITEVLRPELDRMIAEGQRFDVATTFVANKQRRDSHSLGTPKKALPATMTVRCHKSQIAGRSELTCDFVAEPTTPSGEGKSWRLTASVLKDERGFYLTCHRISPFHDATDDAQP